MADALPSVPAVPDARTAVAALVAVQVIFGTFAFVGKIALVELSPFALAALRVAGAGAILAALAWHRSGLALARRDVAAFFVLAMLGIAVNQLLFLQGLSLTTAVDATVLVSTIPAFTLGVAIAGGRETASRGKLVGVALAFTGVLVLVGGAAVGQGSLLGNVLVAANALSYSLYLVFSRPYLARYDPLTVVAWTFLFGAVVMVPLGVPDLAATDLSALSAATWAAVAYIVLFPSVVTYYLNNWALRRLPSSTVASYVYLQPLVAAALAVPILGEPVTAFTLAAGLAIVGGIWVAQGARLPRRLAAVR